MHRFNYLVIKHLSTALHLTSCIERAVRRPGLEGVAIGIPISSARVSNLDAKIRGSGLRATYMGVH